MGRDVRGGRGKRGGGAIRNGWIIAVGPPGECLQNLITLNVITLLDLWMDVSPRLPRYAALLLSSSHTLTHAQAPPPETITEAPDGAALKGADGGFVF